MSANTLFVARITFGSEYAGLIFIYSSRESRKVDPFFQQGTCSTPNFEKRNNTSELLRRNQPRQVLSSTSSHQAMNLTPLSIYINPQRLPWSALAFSSVPNVFLLNSTPPPHLSPYKIPHSTNSILFTSEQQDDQNATSGDAAVG